MSVEPLEEYSKDQLIEELINRATFVGIVIFHRGDAKAGHVDPGEIVMTKSPPLTRSGVEKLLQLGKSLVAGMFGDGMTPGTESPHMALSLDADELPLRVDEGGAVRVGGSRIGLDLVIEQYENGMTPEDMVRAYDTLSLADAHAVIAYYLRHRKEVDTYMKRRAEEAERQRVKIEAEYPRVTPDELLTRRSAMEKAHAPTGQ